MVSQCFCRRKEAWSFHFKSLLSFNKISCHTKNKLAGDISQCFAFSYKLFCHSPNDSAKHQITATKIWHLTSENQYFFRLAHNWQIFLLNVQQASSDSCLRHICFWERLKIEHKAKFGYRKIENMVWEIIGCFKVSS